MYRANLCTLVSTGSQSLRRRCPPLGIASRVANPAPNYFCPPPPPPAPPDWPPRPACSRPVGSSRPCLGWVTLAGTCWLDPAARPPSSDVRVSGPEPTELTFFPEPKGATGAFSWWEGARSAAVGIMV
ncbi:hypothetical protein BCR35DRAFT_310200 [Leucosporidium creatinivorum]|uniref:Uncharacterized protein n=1 Tax=Leucosporidium creatinivorum TaxID=106004 RepID=A0A1Y2D6U6_9BASI|nr:hypothetical protein BCR35DRAFT_310200 [Leucosporidium creatinivorum]